MRKWLYELRSHKKMTHEEVASQAGIKRPYYTMIENGNRQPSVKVAKRIAKVLDFNWTIFYENDSNDSTHKTTA